MSPHLEYVHASNEVSIGFIPTITCKDLPLRLGHTPASGAGLTCSPCIYVISSVTVPSHFIVDEILNLPVRKRSNLSIPTLGITIPCTIVVQPFEILKYGDFSSATSSLTRLVVILWSISLVLLFSRSEYFSSSLLDVMGFNFDSFWISLLFLK